MSRLPRSNTCWTALLLASLAHAAGHEAVGQIVTSFVGPEGPTDWFDSANWTAGIPHNPGDEALFDAAAGAGTRPLLTASATLGALRFGVEGGRVTIEGGSSLVFDRPGAEPAVIVVSDSRLAWEVELAAPVAIALDERLQIEVASSGALEVSSSIVSTGGDVAKSGGGALRLTGNNFGWQGRLIIDQGAVEIADGSALGSPAGSTEVNKLGRLTIANRSDLLETFVMNGGTLVADGATFSGSIELQSDSSLHLFGRTLVASSIVGGAGVEYIVGSSEFATIAGDNSYQGPTVIRTGRVFLQHPRGLGDVSQGTAIEADAELVLSVPTVEPLRIRGGQVSLGRNIEETGPVVLQNGVLAVAEGARMLTPIQLAHRGGRAVVSGEAALQGGVVGFGNLTLDHIDVDGAPLEHDGDVIIHGQVDFNTANAFTGATRVIAGEGNSEAILTVNHPAAFGSGTAAVEVERATLHANVSLDRGVRLIGAHLSVGQDDPEAPLPEIRGPVHIATTANGWGSGISGGVILAPIVGSVPQVDLNGGEQIPLILHADSPFEGMARVSQGRVVGNASQAFGSPDQGTVISGGVLEANAALAEPIVVNSLGRVELKVMQDRLPRLFPEVDREWIGLFDLAIDHSGSYAERVDVAGGRLEINADVVLADAVIREGGGILVATGAELSLLDDDLLMHSGALAGAIRNVQRLVKTTGLSAETAALSGFDGEIRVLQGRFEALDSDALGTSAGATHVLPGAALVLRQDNLSVVDDLFLHNTSGESLVSGLYASRSARLLGSVDLGESGSTVSGTLDFFGPISGGSLIVDGPGTIRIRTPDALYRGDTDIRDGALVLVGDGRVRDSNAIVLHAGPTSLGGSLTLDNSSVQDDDRLPDDAPLHFRGGRLSARGETHEQFGPALFIQGHSTIEMDGADDGHANDWGGVVARVERSLGATAEVLLGDGARLRAHEDPAHAAGILPWMLVSQETVAGTRDIGFGMHALQGFVPVQPTSQDVNAAGPADHVVVAHQTAPLAADTTVASLRIASGALDLGGRTLTVASGGVLGAEISNGTLTTGLGGAAELVLHGSGSLHADIVEAGAPLSVTISPGSDANEIWYLGHNRYSGTTTVNRGRLRIAAESALPDGGSLQVVGGDVRFQYSATQVKRLADVRVAGAGSLRSSGSNPPSLAFDELILESGESSVALAGEGVIRKRSSGRARLAGQSADYRGEVVVEQGHLDIDGLAGVPVTVAGGSLRLDSQERLITLAGGDLLTGLLTQRFSSPVDLVVSADARIVGQQNGMEVELDGVIRGSGALRFTGEGLLLRRNDRFEGRNAFIIRQNNPDYDGPVEIDTVMVEMEQQGSLGTGPITIGPGGALKLGSGSSGDDPAILDVTNSVSLRGGELRGSNYDSYAAQFAGQLTASGHSFLADVNLVGSARLADGATLTVHGQSPTRFLGQLVVEGTAELEYGLNESVSGAAQETGRSMQVLGTIASGANDSVLRLVDRGLGDLLINASLHAADGQSLALLKNGLPLSLTLDGDDAAVRGSGTVRNPLVLNNGAAIDPGDPHGPSIAQLTVDGDLQLGPGTVYRWNVADPIGAPGSDWDFLNVAGALSLPTAADGTWQVRLGDLVSLDPPARAEWLIASARQVVGFDPLAVKVVLDEGFGARPGWAAERFSVVQRDQTLVLTFAVPEPTTACAVGCLALAGALRRRRARLSFRSTAARATFNDLGVRTGAIPTETRSPRSPTAR